MSIKYRTGVIGNPQEPGTLSYYNRAVSDGVDNFDRLARRVSAETGVKRGVVMSILTSLEDIAMERMSDGYTIELGGLGNLYLSIQSESVTDVKELSAKHIKKAKINFKAGKSLAKMAKEVTFEPYRNYKNFEDGIEPQEVLEGLLAKDALYEEDVVDVVDVVVDGVGLEE
ncbi:MAG: hypothetical protein LBV67_10930 [Streptococcaceae bacterium]|nr:hypothetical protein [Streptococcaceae bacterium]